MRRAILRAEIRLRLDDSRPIPSAAMPPRDPGAHEIPRDDGRGTPEEGAVGLSPRKDRGIETEPGVRRAFGYHGVAIESL
jgi:hypothetical protein